MIHRRTFLKTAVPAGIAALLKPVKIPGIQSQYKDSAKYFGVHSFIENHPEAVFIMRTDVDVKTNHDAVKNAGEVFGQSIFVPKDNGVPISSMIPIKPNLTNIRRSDTPKENMEYRMGIVTDPWFVEGIIESMKGLGLSGDQIYLIETWHLDNWGPIGYDAMAERTGAHQNDTRQIKVNDLGEDKVQWIDVPDGVWFRKIPYIWPVNAPNTWLLNISKFKAHGMGLTLCCKNLQGTICQDYQLFCSTPEGKEEHFNPRRNDEINTSYSRHLADGIPRWDSGQKMEKWVARTLDNNSVTPAGLHIIEGVYGRDGDGFTKGPNKGEFREDEAWDYMTNMIIFGKDQFRVDIIGHWLGFHEPGNLGLFHVAIERGLSNALNPHSIPVYEWKNGQAVRTSLADFERTPLKTPYLQKDNEPYYHLLDEPYDYSTETKVGENKAPEAFVLSQNYPNPFNPGTSIEYYLPGSDYVDLNIYNSRGQIVERLVDGFCLPGSHMAVWNTNNHASGTYFCRFRYGEYSKTMKMILLK